MHPPANPNKVSPRESFAFRSHYSDQGISAPDTGWKSADERAT
jgi:hypothetical protein